MASVNPARPDGLSLAERLAEGPVPVAAALRVAIDILRALQDDHASGAMHRDVRPANIYVQPGQPAGTTVLVDLAPEAGEALPYSPEDDAVGHTRYLAPEASGLLGGQVDQRSDLYALGVVVFECLSGVAPFTGATVGEVLRQHLSLPAAHLRAMGLAVPRSLDGVVQRLLAKDPAERYQSAAAVLVDVIAIAEALDSGIDEPAVTAGLHDLRHTLAESAFVGRSGDLATLMGALSRARGGYRGLIVLEAESGGGKTRLLDELAVQGAQLGAWVLRGQGVDQAAQRPFQLLDGVVRNVVGVAELDPPLAAHLKSVIGDRSEAVGVAVPALVGVLDSGDAAGLGPEAFGEARSVDGLSAFVDALGSPERPALVLLDDAQWADGLAVRLLARWWQGPGMPACHVLVVVAFRSEEVGPGHLLRALEPAATVRLEPFGGGEISEMCESMAGPLPAEALAGVIRLADGSPFMATAVLRGMVESGALAPADAGWGVDAAAMTQVRTSHRAALFLLRRFELLSPPARRLLEVGAVLGKSFALDRAVELSGLAASDVSTALEEARRRRIVWVGEDGTCSFTHDKLREGLLAQLVGSERLALHRRAAEQVEGLGLDRVFELAYHFDAAGEPARALPYAVKAAELARERHALDVAVAHFRMAQRSAERDPGTDSVLAARIAEGLADVLILQGSYSEAGALLEQALALTSESTVRAVLDGKLGDLAFKRGDQVVARRHLEGALRDVGRWVPRNRAGFVAGALWELSVQVMHTMCGRRLIGRRSAQGSEGELLTMPMYSRLAYVYWFDSGKTPCTWAHLREMNLAERCVATPAMAQAYSEHAPVMTMVPWYGRGIRYARRSFEIRKDLGDVWGQGQSLGFYGLVLYAGSRYGEAIEKCEEAVRLLERTGDRWEQHTASYHIAFARYRLGELGPAVELARQVYESASAIGDQTSAGVSLSVWSKAALGRVPPALVAAELTRDNQDAHTASEVRMAQGVQLLYAGDADGAVAALAEAATIVAGAGLRQEYVAPVLPWLASAQRTQVEMAGGHAPRQLVRSAARTARRADRLSRSYRNNRPHALRERALMADLRGRRGRARRLMAASVAVAEVQGARYEAALSRLAAARLAVASGRPGAGVGITPLENAVEALEATVVAPRSSPTGPTGPPIGATGLTTGPASLSLADRFESLLAVGHQIASAPSPEGVYGAVREASLTALRGDRCHLVLMGDGASEMVTELGQTVDGASKRLLARAVASRAPVTAADDDAVEPAEGLAPNGMRFVLCAPIICEDRVVACLFAARRQVGGPFGEVEIQLATFVTTLAGAALDHVAGSEARFRSLVHNSFGVITVVDAAGIVVYQSSSISRAFGYLPDEMIGSDLRDWVHPEDLRHLIPFLSSGAAGGPVTGVRGLLGIRLRKRDGVWVHTETTVSAMFEDPSVRGLVLNTRDVSERVALEAELRVQALRDPLTGLANRTLFAQRVDEAFARAAAGQHPFSVAFLDLDDFKAVNNNLGHAAGDLLLCAIARRLLTCVRPDDTVGRLGGRRVRSAVGGHRRKDPRGRRPAGDRRAGPALPSPGPGGAGAREHRPRRRRRPREHRRPPQRSRHCHVRRQGQGQGSLRGLRGADARCGTAPFCPPRRPGVGAATGRDVGPLPADDGRSEREAGRLRSAGPLGASEAWDADAD